MKEEKLKDRISREKLIGKDYNEVKESIEKWEEADGIDSKTIQGFLKGIESDDSEVDKTKEPQRKSSM